MDGVLRPGGSLVLGELIDEHGSAVAFDLLSRFGVNLVDVVADLCSDQPTSSPAYWLELIEEMPEGSHTLAARLGGPEYRGWTFDRHLLAVLVDAVQINTVTTAKVAGAKGVKAPKPIPRPGAGKKGRSAGTPIRALMPRALRKPPSLERRTEGG